MVSETRVESTINSPTQYPSRFCSRRRKFCDRAIAPSTESWWLNPNSVAIGPARRSRWDPVARTAHTVLSELETVKELLDAAPAAEADLRKALAIILERMAREPVKGLVTRPLYGSSPTRRNWRPRLDKPERLCLNVAVPKVMGLLPSQCLMP